MTKGAASGVAVRRFRAGDEVGIREVMEASLATDEIPGFEAFDIERSLVRIAPDPDGTVVAIEDGRVVGYATPNHDDLTVHPRHRRRGHARRLVPAALDVVRQRGQDALQLYVPQHLPGSIAFAKSMGFAYRSSLWRFMLPSGHPVVGPAFPPRFRMRPFDATLDADPEVWVAFMLAAFEGHPTQMTWTPAVVAHVNAASDFDPTGILVVSPDDEPDRRIAFARIEPFRDHAGDLIGNIGLIGVLPAWRGRGLGRELLRWGVADLRRRGVGPIELSVEAANERATGLYRAHGFEPAIEWPHWVLPTG